MAAAERAMPIWLCVPALDAQIAVPLAPGWTFLSAYPPQNSVALDVGSSIQAFPCWKAAVPVPAWAPRARFEFPIYDH